MSIKAHKMQYISNQPILNVGIQPIAFAAKYYEQYKNVYHDCFYEMRKALNLQPYNCCDFIDECLKQNIFLLTQSDKLIGAVSICCNEIDDLIVSKAYQRKGYGKQLLHFAINHLLRKNRVPILHVADWNRAAMALYKNNGFIITKTYEC